MHNVLRSCVVLGLLAAVTTATVTIATVTTALAESAKAKIQFTVNTEGVSHINLTANGPNGKLKGTGTMRIGKSATHPMTVTSGSFTTTVTSSGGGGGSGSGGGGGGGGSSVAGTITLNGYLVRQQVKVPFVLVGESKSGDSTLTCRVTTTTAGTTTTADVKSKWTGKVTLKF